MKSADSTPRRGRPRAFDPEQALDCAMRVFWEKGYLGASLSDLTQAMGINRPSLYAAFGNKEALFRQAIARYAKGPAAWLRQSLEQPTARAVAETRLLGAAERLGRPGTPGTCLLVRGLFTCEGPNDPLTEEIAKLRGVEEAELRQRFKQAIAEGDLPPDADPAALADFLQMANYGLAVLAVTGASRKELLRAAETALRAWPESPAPRRRTRS